MSREGNKKPSLPPFQVAGDEADILLADTYIIKALLVFVNACSYECGGKEKDCLCYGHRQPILQIWLPEHTAIGKRPGVRHQQSIADGTEPAFRQCFDRQNTKLSRRS